MHAALEDQVGLGVLIGKWVGGDPVMIEEWLDFHFCLKDHEEDEKEDNKGRVSKPMTMICMV